MTNRNHKMNEAEAHWAPAAIQGELSEAEYHRRALCDLPTWMSLVAVRDVGEDLCRNEELRDK
jgi:hypothetical protein